MVFTRKKKLETYKKIDNVTIYLPNYYLIEE